MWYDNRPLLLQCQVIYLQEVTKILYRYAKFILLYDVALLCSNFCRHRKRCGCGHVHILRTGYVEEEL